MANVCCIPKSPKRTSKYEALTAVALADVAGRNPKPYKPYNSSPCGDDEAGTAAAAWHVAVMITPFNQREEPLEVLAGSAFL